MSWMKDMAAQTGQAQHTPGPWRLSRGSYITSEDPLNVVAESVAARDLSLISAAPELLAALQALLEAIGGEESTDIFCADARAAIAKATTIKESAP